MIEHNSNKFMWTLGAIAVVVLLIVGAKTFFRQASADVFFNIQTAGQAHVRNVGSLLDIQTPAGASANDSQIVSPLKPADYPAGTKPWNSSHGGLAVYQLNLLVPYKSSLSYTFQLYVKSDPSVKKTPAYLNISNCYSSGASAAGDDLDLALNNQRRFTVNGEVYNGSETDQLVSVPTNKWNLITVSYVNNSQLKQELQDTSSFHVTDPTTAEGPITVIWRHLSYSIDKRGYQ